MIVPTSSKDLTLSSNQGILAINTPVAHLGEYARQTHHLCHIILVKIMTVTKGPGEVFRKLTCKDLSKEDQIDRAKLIREFEYTLLEKEQQAVFEEYQKEKEKYDKELEVYQTELKKIEEDLNKSIMTKLWNGVFGSTEQKPPLPIPSKSVQNPPKPLSLTQFLEQRPIKEEDLELSYEAISVLVSPAFREKLASLPSYKSVAEKYSDIAAKFKKEAETDLKFLKKELTVIIKDLYLEAIEQDGDANMIFTDIISLQPISDFPYSFVPGPHNNLISYQTALTLIETHQNKELLHPLTREKVTHLKPARDAKLDIQNQLIGIIHQLYDHIEQHRHFISQIAKMQLDEMKEEKVEASLPKIPIPAKIVAFDKYVILDPDNKPYPQLTTALFAGVEADLRIEAQDSLKIHLKELIALRNGSSKSLSDEKTLLHYVANIIYLEQVKTGKVGTQLIKTTDSEVLKRAKEMKAVWGNYGNFLLENYSLYVDITVAPLIKELMMLPVHAPLPLKLREVRVLAISDKA